MPTQKRSLTICFERGISMAAARVALGCARRLTRDGNYKGAEGPLRASVEAVDHLQFYVYAYDRESLKTVRGFPSEARAALKVLRDKKAAPADKVKVLEDLDAHLVDLHKRVKESCRGHLPGYAGR